MKTAGVSGRNRSVGCHRHDLVRPLKAQFLVESFRRRNGAEQALRRGIEVVGGDVLGTVLKISRRRDSW